MKGTIIAALFFCLSSFAQTFSPVQPVDFSNTTTKPVQTGLLSARPSTCSVGQQYFASDAAKAGQNISLCTATNVWTDSTVAADPRSFGAKFDSNVLTGGGTDDSVAIQKSLDALAVLGGGTVTLNSARISGVNCNTTNSFTGHLQTSALQIHSNETIDATNGGVFLTANSNCLMLGNDISGDNTLTKETNMRIIGGIWNGNWPNQSKFELGDTVHNFWIYGMWFGGFDGLTLKNVEVLNSTTFSITLSNGRNFSVTDCRAYWPNEIIGHTGNNHDGVHLFGTLDYGNIINFRHNGDDDAIPINTDEGVFLYNTQTTMWGRGRYPLPSQSPANGAITNIHYDGTYFDNSTAGVRFYATGAGNGTASNIDILNTHGTIALNTMAYGATASNINIRDWNVGGFNAITVPLGSLSNGSPTINGSNTAIGFYSMAGTPPLGQPWLTTGNDNVAIGTSSLYSDTTGSHNVAAGYTALTANTTGGANTGLGFQVMLSNSTGNSNTAVGNMALQLNTTGSTNVAVGNNSLAAATTASSNTSVGHVGLTSTTTGSSNTSLGAAALQLNTTGSQNTAVGTLAGVTLTSGNANVTGGNNTWLGMYSGPASTTQLTNSTAVGFAAVVTASNTVNIGNVAVTDVYFGSDSAPNAKLHAGGGNASMVVCWKADGVTLGYATVSEITAGTCH